LSPAPADKNRKSLIFKDFSVFIARQNPAEASNKWVMVWAMTHLAKLTEWELSIPIGAQP
jgi:hypothetical protein